MERKDGTVTYVTYGISQDEFDKDKVTAVKNRSCLSPLSPVNKPLGGLWASPSNAGYGWRDWSINESFRLNTLSKCTGFHLKDGSNILRLSSGDDITLMREKYRANDGGIDFERIARDYTAIELTEVNGETYYALYGWDCESIVVLNPDAIEIDATDIHIAKENLEETQNMIRSEYEEDEELGKEEDEDVGDNL